MVGVECFNCQTTQDVRWYRFDLDLPRIPGCRWCVLALTRDDDDLLAALRPRSPKKPKMSK